MDRTTKHNKAMAKQKAAVDKGIAKAETERGVSVLLTGDGKGKPARPLGWSYVHVAITKKLGLFSSSKGLSLQARKFSCETIWPR